MRAPAGRRAGEEIVERDDAIERGLGKQGPEWEHAAAADPEVDVATPIELRPEGRALRRTGGGARGRAPLGYRLRRDEGHGGKEQGTAEQLPHNEPPGKSGGRLGPSRSRTPPRATPRSVKTVRPDRLRSGP